MARNKDFFVNSAPKRDRSFFVKEDATPKKQNLNMDVKPVNISSFVKSIENSNAGQSARLKMEADNLAKQIKQKEQEYAKSNNISDWNKKTQAKAEIGQELNALKEKLNTTKTSIAELNRGNEKLLTAEQVAENNKNAPLSQKIDKAIKYDIPKTAEKIGRTALDLGANVAVGATNAFEGMADAAVGNLGALASGVTSGFGLAPNSVSEKIKERAEKFANFNFSGEDILEEKKNEGTGVYEPKILGVKVRDALNTISNMVTSAAFGGTTGFMASAAGQNIEEALNDNQSLNRAVVYGDIAGAVEGLTEKMFDAVKLLGGGKFDKFLPKGAIGKLIGGSAGEAIEEVIADGINPFLKAMTYEKGTYDMPTLVEYLNTLKESAWNGFVIGLIMKGGQDISTPQIREQYKEEIYTAVDKSNLPENVKQTVKEVMITPAQAQINQDLQNYRNNSQVSQYVPQNGMKNNLPNYQQIKGMELIKPKPRVLALPEGGRIYVNEDGVAIDSSNYVAPGKKDVFNNNYSVVNGRQVLSDPQNQAQTQNIEQPNVTLPNQVEMAQNANMEQIRDNTKLITQRDEQTLQSAKNDNFHKGLEKFNSKNYTQKDDIVVLDETPQYLYNLGFDAYKPVVLNMSKLETIMKEPKGTFNDKNQHGITMDIVEQLPKAIQNPLNVIKNPKYNDRVVIVTELTDQYGDIVIVPIEMNSGGYIENIKNDVNRINTVYGKENYDIPKNEGKNSYIEYNKDNIIYDIDKDITKNRDVNSNYRLQLPSRTINTSNNSINQNDSSVNTEYVQNNQNDTADTQSAFPMPKNSLLNEIAPIDEKQLENVEEKETTASILTKSPKRPAKDLLKQSVDVFMRKLVDAGNTINTVGKLTGDKHLYEYFNNTKQARQSAEYMIGEAQTDIQGNRVGDSLINVFEEVRAKGDAYTNEFFEYLLHMHNIDRMAQNKPVFGATVTADDSRRIANQLLEKHPEFKKQADKVYAYNRNLMQWRVDSGLISKEQADLMNEMYPHYVPTFRDVSGTSGSRAMQGTVQIANTVRKATGSSKDIMPIDASMARQTMQTVQAAKRNLLGNRLLNDALNNKDKVGEYIQAVEKTTDKTDLETDLDTPKDTNLADNNNVFKIFRNGETYVMQVNNGIYEGLKSISSEIDNTDTSLLLKPVKAANNMFKKLITGYSPMFTIKNFARDIQDAGLYSKNLRGFLKKYPKAYQEMMSNGKMWQLYKSLGGTGSSFFDYETGIEKTLDIKNKTSTKIKDATLGKVEELNMMIEQAPRFAEFMATIEKAGNQNYDTLMEAMLNAADITVNFGRSGTWGKALNSTAVPFFNPSIQGFDKLTRTVLESKDGKKAAKLILRASLLGILPSVLNELLYSDDDEYENLTDRDKDTNFLIKLEDNKWIKIPKGRVLSIFGNTAVRALRTLKGEEWDVGEYLKNQASQTAPISVFDSNLYSPIQAVQNNKTWYGSDIVPQRLQDYAPKDQYDENTDVFSKWLGSKINYSPKKINYLIDAYTGIIGDVVLPLTTPKAETNPFTKAFVVDGVTSNEISNDFYNMLDKYNPKQNPKKSAKEVSRYLNKQSSQVSDIYKQIREVENSDISDDEKRKQVRELRELANTIELTAMATVPEYEKTVDKYRGTFADEDVDSDYAYLFANRDIFGAEYAVKTFSKSLYNNHKNENMDKFFRSYFTKQYFQKKLEPEKTKTTTKNTLPTLSSQRAKLPTLKK